MTVEIAQVAGWVGATMALVGAAVVLLVVAVGVVLLSRVIAARREEALNQDLEKQRHDIERREQRLAEREARLDAENARLETLGRELASVEDERRSILERAAHLSAEEARDELLAEVERQARLDAAVLARDIEQSTREQAESQARRMLATVVQRLASEQTTEASVAVVHLPSDDLKGRIIGREGRNIRAFEQVTGVNVVIDDTPEAVVLSCFDPIRREAGRLTMEALVGDGRIHPTRIEEVHERSLVEVETSALRAGEDACVQMGITDLHPELVVTMGRLKYRTSYGQNVLGHLIESGHLAGMLADELGVDRAACVRGAFLHDLGKALTHEVEGSHAAVGAALARRFGESDDVVHAIEAHHNEVEPRTVEAVITQAADAISGSRPGARRESMASYLDRLHRLEEIALSRPGVEKVFAMQAGRDVRVMVLPDEVDDLAAQILARDIAKQFEEELTYPGQIKVTVVRESRATEVAR